MCRLTINASNLHAGGGIQVAVSVISEISLMKVDGIEISVIVSSEVDQNLRDTKFIAQSFRSYSVLNTYGISALWSTLSSVLKNSDVVFTVFGPLYLRQNKWINIVGFAQPWIIYPNNVLYKKMGVFRKMLLKVKYMIQSYFYKQSDELVVELEHVKVGLTKELGISSESISVIPNCVNSVYYDKTQWVSINCKRSKRFSLGYIARDYPHKNTDILPKVKSILKNKYSIDVDFYVTLSDSEWNKKSDLFRSSIVNAGVLSVSECPSFYASVDAVIFPSLLECFSATPIEAIIMKKPLFASDREFVRNVCGQHAFYFDPEDPDDISRVIAKYINNDLVQSSHKLDEAEIYISRLSNARSRADEIIRIVGNYCAKL
jgi:glycosyltransferase involved in cell wall biosynthesis